jgi:hypothetical protein
MSDEPFALSTVPLAPPASGDYDAICATVMESARGRWFLQEFARRNRNADTSLVLNAIERIERVIRGDRGQQAYQDFRVELLEMAKTIAVTRAEVAEIGPESARAQAPAAAAPPASDAFAAAERIQEVAWTMRERGLEPSTCDQIEALASSILSASALRDPNDRRARKLAEVLQHLERRINAMLDSSAESAPAARAEVEAESETMPIVFEAERQSAASALPAQDDVETEPVRLAEPQQPAAPAPAPAQIDDSAPAWVEVALEPVDTAKPAPAPAAAAEQQPEPQPSIAAEPQLEVAELELAPLVVVPAGQPTAVKDAPVAELELAPLIPARIDGPPRDRDTPADIGLASEAPAGGHPNMRSAAWGTAMSRSDAEPDISMSAPADPATAAATSVAIEAQALAAPDTTMPPPLPESPPDETPAEEFTDFLLEPLPLPVTAVVATASECDRRTLEEPVPEPSDVMSEIEAELFAALPIEETVPGLSPQSPGAVLPAFAPEAPSPPSATAAAPVAMAEIAQGADAAPQATTPIGATTAVPTRTAAKPMPRLAPNDPLAALKAMSDEERIALFT